MPLHRLDPKWGQRGNITANWNYLFMMHGPFVHPCMWSSLISHCHLLLLTLLFQDTILAGCSLCNYRQTWHPEWCIGLIWAMTVIFRISTGKLSIKIYFRPLVYRIRKLSSKSFAFWRRLVMLHGEIPSWFSCYCYHFMLKQTMTSSRVRLNLITWPDSNGGGY